MVHAFTRFDLISRDAKLLSSNNIAVKLFGDICPVKLIPVLSKAKQVIEHEDDTFYGWNLETTLVSYAYLLKFNTLFECIEQLLAPLNDNIRLD